MVIDASFISIALLLPAAKAVLRPGGRVIGMIKPQFEVGREHLKKGVVRDTDVRAEAIEAVVRDAEGIGFTLLDRADSVLAGPEGNVEAFVLLSLSEAEQA